MLEESQTNASDILILLKDDHGILEKEYALLSGRKKLKTDEYADPWGVFYSKLREIKDFYRKKGTAEDSYLYRGARYQLENVFKPPNQKRKLSCHYSLKNIQLSLLFQ